MTVERVRYSHLKYMSLSPAHYLAATKDTRDTPRMRLGRLVDAYLFNGKLPVVWEAERRGNKWKEFVAAHEDREVVTAAEYDKALHMVDAIVNHSDAMRLLRGRRLQEIQWQFLGRDCQSHPDVLGGPPASNRVEFITDLKSSATAQPSRFVPLALRMLYHAQLAFYHAAVGAAGFGVPGDHYGVVVEQQEPYAVTCFRYTERAIEVGSKLCRLWMERLLVCEESGEWPAYSQGVLDLDVSEEYELNFDNLETLEEPF
jgi:hypothetical protein